MHMLQKVCEQLVIIGVLKKSLQRGHRSEDSTGVKADRGVSSQSVESGMSSTRAIECNESR